MYIYPDQNPWNITKPRSSPHILVAQLPEWLRRQRGVDLPRARAPGGLAGALHLAAPEETEPHRAMNFTWKKRW